MRIGLVAGLMGSGLQAADCLPLTQSEPRVQFEVVQAGCQDYNWVFMYVGNPSSCDLTENWIIEKPDEVTYTRSYGCVSFSIPPDSRSDTVTVTLTATADSCPNCSPPPDPITLTRSFRIIGATDDDGGDCGGGCEGQPPSPDQPGRTPPWGSVQVFNTSGPDVRIPLGADDFEHDAGFLNIRATVPTSDLGKPAGLGLPLETDHVQVFTQNGAISQLKTPQGLVNVAIATASQYHLLVYHPANVTTNGGTYSTNGNPFAVYTVSYVSPSVPLKVKTWRDGSGDIREHQFAYNSQNSHWALTDDQSARTVESWTETNVDQNPARSRYHHEVKVSGQTLRAVQRTYEVLSVGEGDKKVLMDSTQGTGATTRTTTYTYDGNGWLTRVVHPDGHWECRQYDENTGQLIAFYSSWGPDSPAPQEGYLPDPSQTRYQATEYAYSFNLDEDHVHLTAIDGCEYRFFDWRQATVKLPRYTGSQWVMEEVARSYRRLVPGEAEERTCGVPGAAWNDTTNLRSLSVFYPSGEDLESDRIHWEQHPDGTLSLYDYQDVSLAEGPGVSTVVRRGQGTTNPVGELTAIIDGTETETVVDGRGRTRSTTTKVIGGLGDGVFTANTGIGYPSSDPSGRSSVVTNGLTGRTRAYQYDCCGLESAVDEDGATTGYGYDEQGRLITTTRYYGTTSGITWTNGWDDLGRVIARQRYGTNNTYPPITLEQQAYDVLGRVTAQTNALGGVTTFAEEILVENNLPAGSRRSITNLTDGGTRIETYLRDGRLKEISGTAVAPVKYAYGIEQDNGVWREYVKETRVKTVNGQPNEDQWTKRYLDGAGRSYKTVYAPSTSPPYQESTYNNLGQLLRDRDTDGVTRLFAYNGRGELVRSAVDIDQNGELQENGATSNDDRITDTLQDVLPAGHADNSRGVCIRRTRVFAFTDNNSLATNLVARTEIATNGLSTWRTVYRTSPSTPVTTATVTTYGANGARTETTTQADGTSTVRSYSYGRLASVTQKNSGGSQVTQTTYAYDPHDRVLSTTDARNGITTFAYNTADQLTSLTAPSPGTGEDLQVTSTFYDPMGRKTGQRLPDGTASTNFYSTAGLLVKAFGSRTYPVEYTYDEQGRMRTMTTWQQFNEANGQGTSGSATTRWNYDTYQGWLKSKDYPDASTGNPPAQEGTSGPLYTDKVSGRLAQRVWKRGITTAYTYNSAGDLAGIGYSDSTPDITYSYDRRGRRTTVVQGTGGTQITTLLSYNDAAQPLTESYTGGSLANFSMSWAYDSALRRESVSARQGTNIQQAASYQYDTAGRLWKVTDSPYVATYTYHANSLLIGTLGYTNGVGTGQGLAVSRAYDKLNRLTAISSQPYASAAPGLPLSYGYQYNSANQRTRANLGDGTSWVYEYDALGQVTAGRRYWGDGTPVAGQDFTSGFDEIGNRQNTGGRASSVSTYTNNRLNQITGRSVPPHVDVVGIANPTANVTVRVLGGTTYTATRKGEYYHHALSVPNSSPQYPSVEVKSLYGATQAQTNKVFVAGATESPTHDADGNLTQDGRWTYTWDGENRLVQMIRDTDSPSGARQKLVFEYDHQGRRIRKTFSTYSGGWQEQSDLIFLYDGWNLVGEFDANASNVKVRTYVWGTDLSGTMTGAGGLGGLLWINNHQSTFEGKTLPTGVQYAAYDGNGNVAALVKATDGLVTARYDYGPFAEPIRASGPMAKANPIRFSTKYSDYQSGLVYYGYRYYGPATGRWLSRDPKGERGGINLYAYVSNDPVGKIDPFGLDAAIINHGGYTGHTSFVIIESDGSVRAYHFYAKSHQTGKCCGLGSLLAVCCDKVSVWQESGNSFQAYLQSQEALGGGVKIAAYAFGTPLDDELSIDDLNEQDKADAGIYSLALGIECHKKSWDWFNEYLEGGQQVYPTLLPGQQPPPYWPERWFETRRHRQESLPQVPVPPAPAPAR